MPGHIPRQKKANWCKSSTALIVALFVTLAGLVIVCIRNLVLSSLACSYERLEAEQSKLRIWTDKKEAAEAIARSMIDILDHSKNEHSTQPSASRPVSRSKQLLLLKRWQEQMSKPSPLITDHATVSGMKIGYSLSKSIESWNTGLIIGVLSKSSNSRTREFIRKTWGRKQKVLFVVSTDDSSGLKREMQQHKDLLILSMRESYDKLVYKTHVLFSAVNSHAGSFRYLMKTDDDCFVFGDKVLAALDKVAPVHYWGRCNLDGAPVVRDPKKHWYVSYEEYPEARYPPYCSGGGYVLSRSFVQCAARESPTQKFISMEDVSTGILAEKCNVSPIHDEHVTPMPDPIVYQLPKTHVMLPKEEVSGMLGLD